MNEWVVGWMDNPCQVSEYQVRRFYVPLNAFWDHKDKIKTASTAFTVSNTNMFNLSLINDRVCRAVEL